MPSPERRLNQIHARLSACRKCPNVCGRAVFGPPLETRIFLLGQAPGVHEQTLGRPFAYTAGKTLFKWLKEATGADESTVRETVHFSAVARCFPGKAKNGAGDRVPSSIEIQNCRAHLMEEIETIRPSLILAVGKLAIEQTLGRKTTLNEVVGKIFTVEYHGVRVKVIPLPHPSGVSRWPQSPEGKQKLGDALNKIRAEFARYIA